MRTLRPPDFSLRTRHQVTAAIDGLAKECVQSQDAASTATLLDVLEKAGIAKRFRLHPESVVVADTNRDEYCVAVKDVCENVEDVVITKWHDSLLRGVATDIPGPQFEKVCQFNEALAAGSGGRLPPIKGNRFSTRPCEAIILLRAIEPF